MSAVCLSFAANCRPDWEGISAVATASAALIALATPYVLQRLAARVERQRRREIVRSVVSTVDSIVALYEVATKLIATDPLLVAAHEACERIGTESIHLGKTLDLLLLRPELSDGPIRAGSAAWWVAQAIAKTTTHPYGLEGGVWSSRRRMLKQEGELPALLATERSEAVRRYWGLAPSTAAARIRAHYLNADGSLKALFVSQP